MPVYRFMKKKLVVNAHGDDIRYPTFISNLVKPIVKKADLLVVPSQYFLEFAKSENLNKNIFASPSGGIDTQKFRPLSDKKSADNFTIGYVSRIDTDKGWDTMIEAYAKLQHKIPKLKLIIIGQGEEEGKMKKLMAELDTQEGIQFLGTIPNHQLIEYYNGFDIFAFPTKRLSESLGVVSLEALACGIPIIGSRIGPVKEYVVDGENGFMFEVGNASDMAQKIERFFNLNPKEKLEFKDNALEISKKYDSKAVVVSLKEKLLELN